MDKSIFVALSGAVLQEKRMEILTDNLANVNTAGFKGQKPLFEDAMPDAFRVRTFGVMDSVSNDMTQGMTEKTDRKLDMAVRGDGFFVIDTPYGNRYTRDGSFTISADGTLVTREGNKVLGEKGPIRLTSSDISVDAVGNIEDRGVVLDRLKLVNFNNLGGISREGNAYAIAQPGTKEVPVGANTQIEQGYIEISNVNAVRAMTTMIEAMRSYETHSKMIQSIDDMTRKAIEEVGRGS